jgi:glutamine synthetase
VSGALGIQAASESYEARSDYRHLTAGGDFQAQLDAAHERLSAAGVEGVYLQIPSVDGRALGKLTTLEHFREAATNGIRLHYGAITDARVDLFGELIAFGEEEREGIGIPDLSTLRIHPWEPRLASAMCFFHNEDTGALLDHCVRGNLLRVENEIRSATGLGIFCGIEPEMMWLRKPEDGPLEHTTSALSFYEVSSFQDLEPVLLDILSYGKGLGLDISHGDSEDSSQLEINLAPKSLLTYADSFFRYRQMCRVVASKHGLICTFMPKPFMGCSGNGHHHHLSLVDDDGQNAVLGDLKGDCRLSEVGVGFLGGLLEHADALTLVGSPTVNSYKRFWDVGHWAPFHKSYDYNNRTSLIRIPAPGRFEMRQFDGSCNAYMTLAACAIAGLDGIKRGLDPGDPTHENVAVDLKVARSERIPITYDEALASFRDDPLMTEAFAPDLHRAFIELREDDWQRYWAQVSQWELDFYLERWP